MSRELSDRELNMAVAERVLSSRRSLYGRVQDWCKARMVPDVPLFSPWVLLLVDIIKDLEREGLGLHENMTVYYGLGWNGQWSLCVGYHYGRVDIPTNCATVPDPGEETRDA